MEREIRGKSRGGSRDDAIPPDQRVRERIRSNIAFVMCRVLEVATSDRVAQAASKRRSARNALSGRHRVDSEQSGFYGSRRSHAELRAQGVVISWQRVAPGRRARAAGLDNAVDRQATSARCQLVRPTSPCCYDNALADQVLFATR